MSFTITTWFDWHSQNSFDFELHSRLSHLREWLLVLLMMMAMRLDFEQFYQTLQNHQFCCLRYWHQHDGEASREIKAAWLLRHLQTWQCHCNQYHGYPRFDGVGQLKLILAKQMGSDCLSHCGVFYVLLDLFVSSNVVHEQGCSYRHS